MLRVVATLEHVDRVGLQFRWKMREGPQEDELHGLDVVECLAEASVRVARRRVVVLDREALKSRV